MELWLQGIVGGPMARRAAYNHYTIIIPAWKVRMPETVHASPPATAGHAHLSSRALALELKLFESLVARVTGATTELRLLAQLLARLDVAP